jgi:predicted DNA-binding transcriptional regulator
MTSVIIDLYQLLKEEIGNGSPNLVTRETGRIIRERVERELEKAEIIYLDFSKIGIIDYSCADEIIAKLVSRLLSGEYGVKFIVLTDLNSTQEENIHVALEKKKIALLKQTATKVLTPKKGSTAKGPGLEIIGFIANHLREVFDLVNERGRLTAKELSDELNLELNTAATRLLNLYKKYLVTRTEETSSEGGRQFVYGRVE